MSDQDDGKLSGKVVDAVRDFGAFLKEVFGPALTDIGDMAHGQTQLWKVQNALRLRDKYDKVLKDRGIKDVKAARPRFGVPLLEAAASEDNEDLQAMWAALLATETAAGSQGKKMHIETLKQLEPAEANLFHALAIGLLSGSPTQRYAKVVSAPMGQCLDQLDYLNALVRLDLVEVTKDRGFGLDGEEEEAFVHLLIDGFPNGIEREEDLPRDETGKRTMNLVANLRVMLTPYGFSFYTATHGSLGGAEGVVRALNDEWINPEALQAKPSAADQVPGGDRNGPA